MNSTEGLWVETDGFGRCRLLGNPHTFPGLIAVWSETLGVGVSISRSDVRDASPEALAWIDGFLVGNEPAFHEFLGINALEAEALPDDDPAWKRYEEAMVRFRSTGSMPFLLRARPTLPPPQGLSPEPWSAAGGEVFGWDGTAWTPPDPQPQMNFGGLVGTVCDDRGHCELEVVGEHHLFCPDCGVLVEVVSVS